MAQVYRNESIRGGGGAEGKLPWLRSHKGPSLLEQSPVQSIPRSLSGMAQEQEVRCTWAQAVAATRCQLCSLAALPAQLQGTSQAIFPEAGLPGHAGDRLPSSGFQGNN